MPIDENVDDSNRTDIAVPRWFVRIWAVTFSFFMLFFVPWATWVTHTIFTGSVSMMVVNHHEDEIQTLQKLQSDTATQMQIISATRFTTDHADALRAGIELKLDRMDTRMGNLQRDFDRQFGKHAHNEGP